MSITSTEQVFIESLQEEKLGLSESFTRSLDLLATGLFTRQGQFFYELIQNAEDCTKEGEETTIEIILRPDAVIFRNNGEQFSKEDIRNLCDVGRTQKKSQDENIGFWGIGFKSVFRVTDSPHVLSGEYQFKFDREYWQDDGVDRTLDEIPWRVTPIWVPDSPVESSDDWNTFHLPYIDDSYKQRVLEGVDQLENRLLLFLEDIKEIRVVDELEDEVDRSREMAVTSRSEELEGRLIELKSNERWWVYENVFEVPERVSNDKVTRERKRENIDARPARIALKVDEDGNLDHLTEGSVHASVFSFLPIQGLTSGMPFMIDADLLTGAGRTKPHEGAAWNSWMMEEIGETLIPNAIDQLKNHDIWKSQFQKALLPSERPKGNLFRTLDTAIMETARQSEIIPTANGSWVTPDSAIHPVGDSREQVREVLSVEDLRELTDRELTDENLVFLKRLLRDRLAIRELGTDSEDLPDSGTNFAELATNEDWLGKKATSKETPWFRSFYELLNETQGFDEDLKERKIVYTDSGLDLPSDVYLSFSPDVEEIIAEMNAEEVFPTISGAITDSSSAKNFLERLDIDTVGAQDLADDLVDHPEMLEAMADEEDVTEWFRELYVALSNSGQADRLSEVPIVFTGESVVRPASDTSSVLLPAESERVSEILNTVGSSLTDVNTVPASIIDPDEGGDEAAKSFLSSLGINQVAPDWVAQDKLLPKITVSDEWEKEDEWPLDTSSLITYTGVVNAELDAEQIDEEIVALTNDNDVKPISEVYLSPTYSAAYDTTSLLDDPVVNSTYLRCEYGGGWGSFFIATGIQSEASASALQDALSNLKDVDIDAEAELKNIYPEITEDIGTEIDADELELLTEANDFGKSEGLFIPDEPVARRVFDDEHFVWLPENGESQDECRVGAQHLGIPSAADDFERHLERGDPIDEVVDNEVEQRIQNYWGRVSSDVPELSSDAPEIVWIEQVRSRYILGDHSKPQTANRCSYYDGDTLYLTREFGHRWDDLATTLLENVDIDVEPSEISSKFVPSVEDAAISEVIKYETKRGREAKGIREDQEEHKGYDVFCLVLPPNDDSLRRSHGYLPSD
ncbi:ATP-binding protein [Salinadaptatus halalkaliphilus]|uniref:ATP-binding protein n=1 Tax=Salinadaptatus halalkaliphilus TaxID=2419781 RepID=A0A4S3TJN9_9EURY|nr:hypothetical protein [Salinadaptatus halalkaliphilus]THE64272.1 ATP-binding protein [Salinadaptatus halalkaliphilus]